MNGKASVEGAPTGGIAIPGEPKVKDEERSKLPPEFEKGYYPLGLEMHVFNIIVKGVLTHVLLVHCLFYMVPFGIMSKWTVLVAGVYGYLTGIGTTVGSHRHWTHKTFEANTPLKVILMLLQTAGFQTTIYKWCVDHRLHHKYMDTNSDPYSAARGFWFSHIGWLFEPSHPELLKNEKLIDVSDLTSDPVVRFQAKYYWELFIIMFFILPMAMIQYFFPELTFYQNLALNFARYGVTLHFTFLVNSVAHIWGDKPYDKYITPTDNVWVSIFAIGEGWHNYHHTFPWDYKSAELGNRHNVSTAVIHFFAKMGWAWDLKTVSHKLLVDRINRTGSEIHPLHRNHHNRGKAEVEPTTIPPPVNYWGWGDKELRQEDVEITETLYPSRRHVKSG